MMETTITNLRKNLFETIDQVIRFNGEVRVSTKNGNAILISEEDYEGIMETLYLNSIPGMVQSIRSAADEPIEECAKYVPGEEW